MILMNDLQELAQKLKDQLEEAQRAKVELGTSSTSQSQQAAMAGSKVKESDEDNVVVLTRTGRDGIVRPLPEQTYGREVRGKQRQKKNVSCFLYSAIYNVSIFI